MNNDVVKEQYLRKYEVIEGIILDKNNIKRNPDRIMSSQSLTLNLFWGNSINGQTFRVPRM